jgi:hypothetical protein
MTLRVGGGVAVLKKYRELSNLQTKKKL